MQIKTEFADIPVAEKTMRALVTMPAAPGRYPGILYFSDIFQLTEPMMRACARLAGYGFVVVAHEIFHRLESAGTVFPFNDEGRTRGLHDADNTPVAHYDEDTRAALDYLKEHPLVDKDKIGAGGFCIGGHLAFRAAFNSDVRVTACYYPSWLHSGKLGPGHNSQSLERAGEIQSELLLVFGNRDALLDSAGRARILTALQNHNVNFTEKLYDCEHAFMRDDRPTFDPEAADQAFAEAVSLFRRVLN